MMSYWSAFTGGASISLAQSCRTRVRAPFQCLAHSRRYVQPNLRNVQTRTLNRKKRMGYLLLVMPIAAFGLGVWQINRRKWKLELIKDLESRTTRPPTSLPETFEELDDIEFCRVKVTGRFDHSREVYILPRANNQATDNAGGPSSSGAYVITPFILEDGRVILVNRGWVPRHKTNPDTRQSGQVQGKVDLIGLVRKTEVRSHLSDHGGKSTWHIRDVEGISETLGTLSIFLDADSDSTVEGGPIGGQTRISLRNDHLQYIITWFSLSAATFFLWVKWFLKR